MIDGLDPFIHGPKRLAAMAAMARATEVSFRFLKEHLRISESDLSKQMSALETAGYISSEKQGRGRGGSTTYSLTRAGRRAFEVHCAALRAIIGDA